MKTFNHEIKLMDEGTVKKAKPKKSIHQILVQLQSQGVNATLCKRRSKLALGL
ncbi:hypothetical protein [Bacillus sp. REN16]|uniref:hypothetical protein n=1 Tax=Bacillus sp. REN16 TaxID=2887296 RepID=UPI001E28AA1C|nr:hypothetical protein [Bacillus sp. REN16]MCC3357312.1 hypothetical protein [Bacillus sp. REN16]